MAGSIQRVLVSLVLLSHVLATVPAPLGELEAAADRGLTAEPRDCCPAASGTVPENGEESRNCCPEGCEHCPLSCCGGGPALVEGRPEDPAQIAAWPAPASRSPARLPDGGPRKITHPPRG